MTPETLAKAEAVIDVCQRLNTDGLNQGTAGNVSVRTDAGMLITPSGVAYEDLTPERLVPTAADGRFEGALNPSSEWRMHADIYQAFAEAGAVVHVHATFCTALACRREPIPAFHYMVAVAGGRDIPVADYATFGTPELSDAMIRALDGRRACLLANHGMICHAETPHKALALAIEVESLARQYWYARQGGEPVILSDAQMDAVMEKFKTYGRQPALDTPSA
ncbi:L-fuculose 1-phosphate aldolase [Rhodothalassium salexigens DSM 2132]|uniref:L-fuculose 1-phosphate aldolase n=1 Tax=Rhodothalassium salexigens DSM 2132 TaxID=1188247 RepID=A0A4R2P9D0_RHOSA|nr:class II aldolase/adducin family protein [Rhodothalassium salexigens]MBB4212451.1 L-fuculose-phosphate aldolase [Rhodothalassium salexigens DSM 2132]MBK1639932.1 class II aldolase [Rhodothalassium salexigens DSM 2132]TCP31507.1 L-fuculose 1-phosphate aldolase [Rhodothalassium salexigens DSM 2132]